MKENNTDIKIENHGNDKFPFDKELNNDNGKKINNFNLESDKSQYKLQKNVSNNQIENYLYISEGKPVSIYQLYFEFTTRKDLFYIILAIIGSLASGISMPLFSILYGGTISQLGPRYSNEDFVQNVNTMVVKFIYIGLGMFVAYFLNSTFWIYTSIKNLESLKKDYFRVIMKQEQGWFDQNNPFQFASKVQSQIKTIENGLGDKLGNILTAISMFFSGLVIAFITSWKLTLVLLSVLPFLGIGTMLLTKAIQTAAKKAAESYTKAGGVAEEVLYQIKTVASFANFEYEIDKYNNLVNECKRLSIKNSIKSALGVAIIFFFIYSAYSLAIWFGSRLILEKEINHNTGHLFASGDILIVLLSVVMAGFSLGAAAPNIKAISEARVAASDYFELRKRVPHIDLSKSKVKIDKKNITGKLELKNVLFAYPNSPENNIINNISIVFDSGKKIALIGESGSGKSTIVNLIERLYEVTSGQILLDGIDIKDYDLETYRGYIGYVQQEPVLFNKSIKENIIFGRENISFDMIKEACEESLASEFIEKINETYDFQVGIKGKNLSGGQKQRIAIARAILTKPKILILDEATSALDNKNEKEVQLSLDKVTKNVTTMIIAHRLSTIINADLIVAIRKGEIVEFGTHGELMKKENYYFSLFKTQLVMNENNNINVNLNINGMNNSTIKNGLTSEFADLKNLDSKRIFDNPSQIKRKNSLHEIHYEKILSNNHELDLKKESEIEKREIPNDTKLNTDIQDENLEKVEAFDNQGNKNIEKNNSVKEKNLKANKRKVLKFFSDRKRDLFFAMFSAACSGTIYPVYGVTLATAIDVLSSKDDEIVDKNGFFISMMFLVIAAGSGISLFFQNYYFSKIGEILCQKLRSSVFKKYLEMHIGFYDEPTNTPGSLITRLSSDTTKLNGIVLSMIGVSVQSAVCLLIGLILGFYYDWRLSLISLAFLPLIVISSAAHHKMSKGLIESDELLDIESGALLSESVINTRTIFSFNVQEKILEYYGELIMRGKKSLMKQSIITGISYGFGQFILFVTYAVVFYSGGQFINSGTLSFGNMIKAIFCILFSAFGLGQAQQYIGDYTKAENSLESIFSILDAKSLINPLDEKIYNSSDATKIVGKIEFKNVSFSYPTRKDQKVLKNLSFVTLPGQNIAFTGFSGSGKSTIIQLIERFYDCDEGEILIDDINIREYNIISLRKKIGLVMQEPNIFKRSVIENIEYGKLNSCYDEIKAAAIKANIGEFFSEQSNGLKDDNVSGGQKQRISIARAILKDPCILLLDEATSALDKNSETEVQRAIESAMLNRTTITIAHRLATIEKCDIIYLINQGKIFEKGTHKELLNKKGKYWTIFNSQSN